MLTGLLAEEFLFRGAIYELTKKAFPNLYIWRFSGPVLISSIFFGLQHLGYHHFQINQASISQVIYTFIMGLFFGVLDFEWAFAGDPLYDFCSVNYMESTWPGSKKNFLKGYGFEEFDPDALLKIRIYQMIRNIELCIVARKYFSSEESEEFINVTLNQINSLQKV
jgi:hypothetical protein